MTANRGRPSHPTYSKGWPEGAVRVSVGSCEPGQRVGIEGVRATVVGHTADVTRVRDVHLGGNDSIKVAEWLSATRVYLLDHRDQPVVSRGRELSL